MNINTNAIDEGTLAILYLTPHDHYRASKGFDLDVLNRLYEKRLHLRPGQQDEVGGLYRARVTRIGEVFQTAFRPPDRDG